VSLPATLVVPALEQIVARVGAVEVTGPDGGPFRSLTTVADGAPAGQVRVFTAQALPRIVYTNLAIPAHDLDSHMFYAFAPVESAVPHFTLDAVATRGIHAFHVDLVPRVELATHMDYMVEVFAPLDATQHLAEADEGFLPAVVPLRGRAMMSPWMLANRLSEADFPRTQPPSAFYLDHWLDLVDSGLSAAVVTSVGDVDLPARDAVLRHNLFGLDVDPAWDMAAKLVGDEPIKALRGAMQGNLL